jgi:dihydroorotate dehydrogenase
MSDAWKLGQLEVDSPWGNAGGVVRTAEEAEAMARTGVGWIEAGSYTLEPWLGTAKDHPPGNPDKVVYHYNEQTGESTNSLSMPNGGKSQIRDEVPEIVRIAHGYDKKAIVNVAPVSENPVNESIELVTTAAEAGADLVLWNPACPNVFGEDGQRHKALSGNPKALRLALQGLKPLVDKYGKIGVRLAPAPTYDWLFTTIKAVESTATTSVIWLPNTWAGHKPLDADGNPILQTNDNTGGLSGPAMAAKSLEQLKWAKKILRGSKINLVSSSGIADNKNIGADSALQLRKIMSLGALGAGTTFYYQPIYGWKEDTDRLLMRLARF